MGDKAIGFHQKRKLFDVRKENWVSTKNSIEIGENLKGTINISCFVFL